jgi:uncharacterized protein
MSVVDEHFLRGVELFNRGEFFEAHEEMEEAMNLLEDDSADWDFFLGLLRAAVANHKLWQHETKSAILHLGAALKFLAPFPDRHRGLKLREFRSALTAQLARLQANGDGAERSAAPHLEFDAVRS